MSNLDTAVGYGPDYGRQYELTATLPIDYTDFVNGKITAGTAIQAFGIMGAGAIVTGGSVLVTTAFAGAGPLTAATLALGDTGSATRYGAAVNIFATGNTALTGTPFNNVSALPMLATVTLTGGTGAALTAGHAIVIVRYIYPGRAHETENPPASRYGL